MPKQFKGSVTQSDRQSKQTCCVSIAARLHGGPISFGSYGNACYAGYSTGNFVNGSECKGLSTFTGKFPSWTAGLYLVLNTSFLRKKITFSPLSYGRMFSRDNDQRETLILLGVSSTVLFSLREINRFLKTLSSFCIFEKALFLDPRTFQASRIESRASSFECQLTFERYCTYYQQLTDMLPKDHRQLADCWSVFWPKPVGHLSAVKQPICHLADSWLTVSQQMANRLFWELFFTITYADTLWACQYPYNSNEIYASGP